MKLGIAGCGRIAESGYIPAAQTTPGVEIVAFTDPDQERLGRCLDEWRRGGGAAEGFDGIASLLEGAEIDLLVVAAPAAAHLPLAEAAAAAEVHSLVEKPPAADLVGARGLAELEPQPFIAFNRRFLQGTELRDTIPAQGWLELDLEMSFRRAAWGAHEARDEALLDAGVHLIDLACHLSGAAPVAVRGAEVDHEQAQFELELSRGRARIQCSTNSRHREFVAVRDRAGKMLGRNRQGGVRGRFAALTGTPDLLRLSLGRQLEALRDASATDPAFVLSPPIPGKGRTPLATAADGATAMAVVEAVRHSAALDGAEVTVAPVEAAA